MKFTIALLQIAPVHNEQDKNLEKGIQYCRQAKARGADLAVFPPLPVRRGRAGVGARPNLKSQISNEDRAPTLTLPRSTGRGDRSARSLG